jgi:hypothetical protein
MVQGDRTLQGWMQVAVIIVAVELETSHCQGLQNEVQLKSLLEVAKVS